ncbi:MAG TPA: 4Fe-4S dicluster domain-containing protein [Candidatus Altiarchaeales archaeon]|nr:4Fe-4S dicluster domain-containing protein [Candidatus Altiarchaeales archaeon]
MVEIKIDMDACTGCGTCVDTCPVGLYEMNDDKVAVTGDKEECVICRACESACPSGAIEVVE